jgi:hypothetical protein
MGVSTMQPIASFRSPIVRSSRATARSSFTIMPPPGWTSGTTAALRIAQPSFSAGAIKLTTSTTTHTLAPPAPDGSYTKFLVLIQTYVENPADTVYSRMPETDEMYQWVQQIVLSRKDRVGGVMWYSWERIASHYQMWLKQNRYDTLGRDRWQTMSNVAALLRQSRASELTLSPGPVHLGPAEEGGWL